MKARIRAEVTLTPPELTAWRYLSEQENGIKLVPGERDRPWIDAGHPRARECPPFRVANAIGWDIVAPYAVTAAWAGGDAYPYVGAIGPASARAEFMTRPAGAFAMYLPFILRTPPGWAVNVRGIPNVRGKPNAVPLEAVIESSWYDRGGLGMHWKFTKPGVLAFQPGEPLGFVTLVPHAAISNVRPTLRWGEESPEVMAASRAVAEGRDRQHMQAQGYARGIRSSDGSKTTTGDHHPGLQVCPFAEAAPLK